jgi:pimeloyl-ACP methyl ester carboxylesterase
MPRIDLPHGTVQYRVAGSEKPGASPVVFVHGFLVNATLWTKTADALATAGVRSYAADWPLGSHTIPIGVKVDQSPRGIARQIIAFMEALELDNVTLVGNDTGGAICQLLLDSDASRIGRVVLTNCDAFTNFPPAPFDLLFKSFRSPTAIRVLLAPMRAKAIRHSPAGFGLLVRKPLDAGQTSAWVEPCLSDPSTRGSRWRIKPPRQLRWPGAAGLGGRGPLLQARLRPPARQRICRRQSRRDRERPNVRTPRRADSVGRRDRQLPSKHIALDAPPDADRRSGHV